MKGKCYSKVNRGQRNKSDFYQTPYLMTQALFDNELFDDNGSMLEPACGKMAIVKIIKNNFYGNLTYYDIENGMDFLEEKRRFDYLITNPPYSLANEFILHAIQRIKYKFCLLLPLNYLQGQKRYNDIYNIQACFCLTKIYVFTRMPMLSEHIREDGKYKTGMQAYAWYIWEKKDRHRHPIVFWLDSSNHIDRS